ncbi:ECF transporter S component [Konateibacter massiliensis]|uniref:ECF transporter S component n=1 Tax=Konateibacter massiliensis TaxID=2002841 RepID=UPI000C15DE2A|nr:ECF transporter S component [Konateibacter massiliensis]
MNQTNTTAKPQVNLYSLALNGMFIALTLVATSFINVKLPIAANGGLIHLGNVPLFIAAILFGKRTGVIAGAFGMGLFDLLSGWTLWAPFTFVIVGLMGYTVGAITEKKNESFYQAIAMGAACVIKVAGYYIAEVILYQNVVTPIASIPGNILQVAIAAVVVFPLINPLRKGLQK